jgi:hypothetical protein
VWRQSYTFPAIKLRHQDIDPGQSAFVFSHASLVNGVRFEIVVLARGGPLRGRFSAACILGASLSRSISRTLRNLPKSNIPNHRSRSEPTFGTPTATSKRRSRREPPHRRACFVMRYREAALSEGACHRSLSFFAAVGAGKSPIQGNPIRISTCYICEFRAIQNC